MSIKSSAGKFLKKLLPWKYYKLVANGFIVIPAYYRTIIADAEKHFDLSQKDSDEKELLLMRKYAHILDKGLHRADASPGHSKNYYSLLSKSISRLENTKYKNDLTLIWAKSKLLAYEQLQSGVGFEPLHGEPVVSPVSIDEFSQLVKQRRSNRSFTEKEVSLKNIEHLKSLANWASSSCNKQPIEIYVTNNPQKASLCLKCCKGGTGFSEHIPSFWAFSCDILGYVWPSEIFLPVIDTCLGIQNVMLGATSLGMSGTLLSWAQKSTEEESQLKIY